MQTAAIGIGSNSLRMLVADFSDGKLKRLRRAREGLRVFSALDERGNLSREMMRKACEKVSAFIEEAREMGAGSVHLFATSAVRDARNQDEFQAALETSCGLPLEILSGEMEARLSFIGATDGESAGLIDIGGGSTEIAAGEGWEPRMSLSLQMGAVRLERMQPIANAEQALRVVALAKEMLLPCRDEIVSQNAKNWIGVGGTFTTSASLIKNIPWNKREGIHGFRLEKAAVEETMRMLAPMPLKDRLLLPGLQPQRADIVVHGIAILDACMELLQIPSVMVSEYGNLEGYLKLKYLCA